MKKQYFLALLLPLSVGFSRPLRAQTPSPCGTVAPTDMTSRSFATWDWETPRTNAQGSSLDYCRTWAIRRTSQSDQSVGNPANAPWESAQSGVMLRIGYDKDYTRAKGWVLLRENLGALVPVGTPYFVLYNKYTGLIRTYFYVDNSHGEYVNGAVVTMSHSSVNAQSTGVLALSNTQLLAAEKYSQRTDQNSDVVSYVAKLSSQQASWIVAEFNTAFDPNAGDSRFAGNALEFAVQGIKRSELSLDGTLNFKTDAQEGYAVAGKRGDVIQDVSPPTNSDPASGTKKFLATGKKILGAVKPEDAEKFFKSVNEKATKLLYAPSSQRAGNQGRLEVFSKVANATQATGGLLKTVKNVLSVAGGVSTAFGIIGSVVGFLWPDKDAATEPQAPAFTPTVSTGSISLSGSITTTYPLANIVVQVPGTQHLGNGSTQSYYDCKLGIFTIKNTPVLNKLPWDYEAGTKTDYDPCYIENAGGCQGEWVTQPVYDHLESYQVSNDIIASYNQAAGLTLLSVEAALVAESSGEPFYPEGYYSYSNTETRSIRDYMQDQFQAGVVELIRLDADKGTHTFQTPFVSLACFKNMSITVKPGTTVSVRVKAILRPTDQPTDSPPVYYVQDYAVGVNTTGVVATNPRYLAGANEPPFTNLAAGLDPTKVDLDLSNNTGNATQFTAPFVFQAMNSVTAANNGPTPPGTDNSITINHPGSAGVTKLLAGNVVALGEGFSVTPGTSFVARAELIEQLTCGPLQAEATALGSCPYNTGAYPRVALATEQADEAAASNDFTLYPNPTHGQVQLELHTAAGTATAVSVYNVYGSLVQQLEKLPRGQKALQLNLESQPAGIYIVQVTVGQKTISKKVVLQ